MPLDLGKYEAAKSRKLARYYWIITGGDRERSKQMFVSDPSLVGQSLLTTEQMIVLAGRLWRHWREQGVDVPSETPSESEPQGVGE